MDWKREQDFILSSGQWGEVPLGWSGTDWDTFSAGSLPISQLLLDVPLFMHPSVALPLPGAPVHLLLY